MTRKKLTRDFDKVSVRFKTMKEDGIMMDEGISLQDHTLNREDSEIYILLQHITKYLKPYGIGALNYERSGIIIDISKNEVEYAS